MLFDRSPHAWDKVSKWAKAKSEFKKRAEAVEKIQAMMDEEAVKTHMGQKHPGEPVPSVAQAHQMVAERTAAA